MTLRARDQGWRAGLLESGTDLEAFAEVRANWQPRQPHLIVLDYVVKPTLKAKNLGLAWRLGVITAPSRVTGFRPVPRLSLDSLSL